MTDKYGNNVIHSDSNGPALWDLDCLHIVGDPQKRTNNIELGAKNGAKRASDGASAPWSVETVSSYLGLAGCSLVHIHGNMYRTSIDFNPSALPLSSSLKLSPLVLAALTMGCITLGVGYDLLDAAHSAKSCYEDIKGKPQYALLYEKLAIFGEFPSDDQLADTEKPSEEAIQSAMKWYEESQVCGKNALEIYSNLSPELGAQAAGWLQETTDIFNDTMAIKPSYGEINRRIKHLRQRQRDDVTAWVKEETKRRELRAEREPPSFISLILDTALRVLVAKQLGIARTQRIYLLEVPTYQKVNLTKTVCFIEGKKFACRLVPTE